MTVQSNYKGEGEQTLFVDRHGGPLVTHSHQPEPIARVLTFQRVLESTATLGIVSAILYYLGSVYYRNFFGSFGPQLIFPSLGTSEYLTKAFDLLATHFTYYLLIIWILTFIANIEYAEDIAESHRAYREVKEMNRIIGNRKWQILKLRRESSRVRREIKQRNPNAYGKISQELGWREHRHIIWAHLSYRIIPHHISRFTMLFGFVTNLYLFLTVTLVSITAYRIDALSSTMWLYAAAVVAVGGWVSITGRSLLLTARDAMERSLLTRLYLPFVLTALIVVTAPFLVVGKARYDARQFVAGRSQGANVTVVDTRTPRPDLEGQTFRVLIHRDGNYYLIPDNQTEVPTVSLVIVPESELVTITTGLVEP